jgi:hypothetical protein
VCAAAEGRSDAAMCVPRVQVHVGRRGQRDPRMQAIVPRCDPVLVLCGTTAWTAFHILAPTWGQWCWVGCGRLCEFVVKALTPGNTWEHRASRGVLTGAGGTGASAAPRLSVQCWCGGPEEGVDIDGPPIVMKQAFVGVVAGSWAGCMLWWRRMLCVCRAAHVRALCLSAVVCCAAGTAALRTLCSAQLTRRAGSAAHAPARQARRGNAVRVATRRSAVTRLSCTLSLVLFGVVWCCLSCSVLAERTLVVGLSSFV